MHPVVLSLFDSVLVVEFRSVDLNYIQKSHFLAFLWLHPCLDFCKHSSKENWFCFFDITVNNNCLISANNNDIKLNVKSRGLFFGGILSCGVDLRRCCYTLEVLKLEPSHPHPFHLHFHFIYSFSSASSAFKVNWNAALDFQMIMLLLLILYLCNKHRC